MKKISRIAFAAAAIVLAASCSAPKKVPYFQDTDTSSRDTLSVEKSITFRSSDQVMIIVSSRDAQLTNLLNLPYITQRLGDNSSYSSSYSQGVCGYLVGEDGNIDFPVLGKVRAAGLTRNELSNSIKERLIREEIVKDPIVTVDYMNLKVSVLGEVAHPGRFSIDKDAYTLMDALSAAGDLTIYGQRDKVKVLRSENGVQTAYVVNLCSASDVVNSPVYYLQQNDIVYVEPNKVRARQTTANGNNLLSTSFWMSVASLAVTISLYFIK